MSKYITLLEIRDRRPRMTRVGSEIITTWYCEPASAAPIVIAQLLGGVSGNTINDRRILPARDYQFPYCYCVSAHEVPMDPRSVSSGPNASQLSSDSDTNIVTAALFAPAIFDGPMSIGPDGKFLPLPKANNKTGRCGAMIEAIYRPLYTVYKFPEFGSTQDYENQFDYIDPQVSPNSRTFPVGSMLQTLADVGRENVHCQLDQAAVGVETWNAVTIRRVMCPRVPYTTINALKNRINGVNAWNPAKFTLDGLPDGGFPFGVIRFDDAEVIPCVVPSCLDSTGTTVIAGDAGIPATRPMRCYDIVLHFSWRTIADIWWDSEGEKQSGPVPWSCDWFNGKYMESEPLIPGWYEGKSTIAARFISTLRPRYLNAEDDDIAPIFAGLAAPHPFDALFLQDAP